MGPHSTISSRVRASMGSFWTLINFSFQDGKKEFREAVVSYLTKRPLKLGTKLTLYFPFLSSWMLRITGCLCCFFPEVFLFLRFFLKKLLFFILN
jgi:hypothetical protein